MESLVGPGSTRKIIRAPPDLEIDTEGNKQSRKYGKQSLRGVNTQEGKNPGHIYLQV